VGPRCAPLRSGAGRSVPCSTTHRMAARAVSGQQWAGNFECEECGRKRLPAAEFSRKQLQKGGTRLRCKRCVDKAQELERRVALEKAANEQSQSSVEGEEADLLKCCTCSKELMASHFSRSQRQKHESQRRCSTCVERAEQDEKNAIKTTNEGKLREARLAAKRADLPGVSAKERLAALSAEAAVEAELVTGLRATRLGRGRGRGRSRGTRGAGHG